MRPGDTVYVVGNYPYDLPFYAQIRRPLVVIQDWALERKDAGDVWQRELFEGADFDPVAARVLQTPAVLPAASRKAGDWLLAPRNGAERGFGPPAWLPVQTGTGWVLFKSGASAAAASAPKGPKSAQQKGLPGCQQ